MLTTTNLHLPAVLPAESIVLPELLVAALLCLPPLPIASGSFVSFFGRGVWKRWGENIWVSFLWILYTPTCGIRGAVAGFSPAESQSSSSVELLCLINLLFAHEWRSCGTSSAYVHLHLFHFFFTVGDACIRAHTHTHVPALLHAGAFPPCSPHHCLAGVI